MLHHLSCLPQLLTKLQASNSIWGLEQVQCIRSGGLSCSTAQTL